MSDSREESLLARLAHGSSSPDQDPWAQVAASKPSHQPPTAAAAGKDDDAALNGLIGRIHRLASSGANAPPAEAAPLPSDGSELADSGFVPTEPTSLTDAGLRESEVESLILKYLLACGDGSGRDIADQVRLPFMLIEELIRRMKQEQLIVYRGSAAMNDYVCQLTDLGRERARRLAEHCTYYGAAPVSLEDYIECVKAQSLDGQQPSEDELQDAFADLLINPRLFAKLGPAINSGRGMFLYGYPGNGKTSIAERVTGAFGQCIWIPRTLGLDGEIMRLFDPMNHDEVPPNGSGGLLDDTKIDRRWVRIRRPTILAGGELTMSNLEVMTNPVTGICEAPLQLKSNCGSLVIDDFGRQQMSTDELLNRWIVPLEKRYDFLNLPNGKKIQVPFDQLIVFSTNLEPRDLVDEAFLRRIPYKIEVTDPTEEDFRELFRLMCPKLGFEYDTEAIEYLMKTHYRDASRPYRACQPRDLLLQVRNFCLYHKMPLVLSPDAFDFAVENYFSVM